MSSKEVVRGIWPRIFMTALAILPVHQPEMNGQILVLPPTGTR